ncbi:MAG: hypothetical protein AMXMBFR64_08370 [Myxococcales bacterium]
MRHHALLASALSLSALAACGELTLDSNKLLAAAGVEPTAAHTQPVAALDELAWRYLIQVSDQEEAAAVFDEVRALAPADALLFRAAVRALQQGQTLADGPSGDVVDLLLVDEATAQGTSFIDLSEADVEPVIEEGSTASVPGLGTLSGALCAEGEATCAYVPDWPGTMAVAPCTDGCYGASAADRVTHQATGCATGGCAVRITFHAVPFTRIGAVTAAASCVLSHAQGALPSRMGAKAEVRVSYTAIRKCGLLDETAAEYLRGRVLGK